MNEAAVQELLKASAVTLGLILWFVVTDYLAFLRKRK